MKTQSPVFKWMVRHAVATYVLMACAFLLFGALSLDMAKFITANAEYVLDNGWTGLVDGGFKQAILILLQTLVAIAAYLIFKLCEHALIERAAHYDKSE